MITGHATCTEAEDDVVLTTCKGSEILSVVVPDRMLVSAVENGLREVVE